MNSIWSTVEVDAWSRGFDYEDYLHLHSTSGIKQVPLARRAYYELCIALYMNMDEDLEEE